MILNLFKSKKKWQHKDSNVRITAVNEELDCNNDENKNTLLSLLNTDSSELVRRAVLLKFNSFDDYYNASIMNDNKAIQEFSYSQVQDVLLDTHDIKLTVEQKESFLALLLAEPSINFSLLNYWLEHEAEPKVIVGLFQALTQKKNISSLLLQTFIKKSDSQTQLQLLSLDLKELNEITVLTKLLKKSANDDVIQVINNKLAQLIEQQEKPKRIHKQCQLVLSKLLALKDISDFGQYLVKKSTLEQEWQQCVPELPCLLDEEQQVFITKHDKITSQITQLFAPKEEAYQQEKIAAQLAKDKEAVKTSVSAEIATLNQVLTTAVFEGDSFEQSVFLNKLKQLHQQLVESVLNEQEQASYAKQVIQLEKRLTQLPEIAESVSQATYLVSKISQLTLPNTLAEFNERQQVYRDWLTQWQAVEKQACGVLPQSIKDAHKEVTQLWQNGLQPLQVEQKQLFSQTKKKLFDLKRLLLNGKYKVCFGLFKGVNQSIPLLSVNQQHQLQRDFDSISKQIAEISDWEHYIATPRKKQLLAEITQLVKVPLDNPNEQADKVKQYRKTWNSLGHADEELDHELNAQFNLACEEAFAPCRLFYAEQEKLREQHLVTRNDIISQAKELAESMNQEDENVTGIDYKLLDGQLNKLQQRWQQAGEIDRQRYQKLYRQFKSTLQPIKKSIKSFHDTNGSKKQDLIVAAEQQLTHDDVYQAIDTVKALQQQWRNIGFAGTNQESKLWQKFRAINDQVFAKRDLLKTSQQSEVALMTTQFTQTLNSMKADFSDSHLESSKEQAENLLAEVKNKKPIIKSVVSEIELFIKDITNKLVALENKAEQASWRSLFILLNKIATDENEIDFEQLLDACSEDYQNVSVFWQKRLQEHVSLKTMIKMKEREVKTLEIEILAQVDSPKEYAGQRLAVQISLMQEQMLSGGEVDLSSSLVDWLRLGKLTSSDVGLLERLSKIYS